MAGYLIAYLWQAHAQPEKTCEKQVRKNVPEKEGLAHTKPRMQERIMRLYVTRRNHL